MSKYVHDKQVYSRSLPERSFLKLTRIIVIYAVLVDLTSPTAALQAGLPFGIKAVACRNKKKRYFLPSKASYFGGICYEYVMVDNGCNTLLYPFHSEVLTRFAGADFT